MKNKNLSIEIHWKIDPVGIHLGDHEIKSRYQIFILAPPIILTKRN